MTINFRVATSPACDEQVVIPDRGLERALGGCWKGGALRSEVCGLRSAV